MLTITVDRLQIVVNIDRIPGHHDDVFARISGLQGLPGLQAPTARWQPQQYMQQYMQVQAGT